MYYTAYENRSFIRIQNSEWENFNVAKLRIETQVSANSRFPGNQSFASPETHAWGVVFLYYNNGFKQIVHFKFNKSKSFNLLSVTHLTHSLYLPK